MLAGDFAREGVSAMVSEGHGRIIEFCLYRPDATRVRLAGDFNAWNANELAMGLTLNGHWVARLELAPGRYRFGYWVDGRWTADAWSDTAAGPNGPASILEVPAA